MAPLPVEPKDGEHLSWLLGILTALGGVFVGFKRIRGEVREIAKEAAEEVADARLETHVKEKHDPLTEQLTEIRIGVARIEAHLAEKQVSLAERIEAAEERCKDNIAKGLCVAPAPGGTR